MNNYPDKDECTTRGACSTAPCISALQELIYNFIVKCAHYIVELEKIGGSNEHLKQKIVNDLAALVFVGEFDKEQLFNIVINEYQYYINTRQILDDIKEEKNDIIPKLDFEFNPSISLNRAVIIGQKIITEAYSKFDLYEKSLKDIYQILLKGCCLNLSKLQEFNTWDKTEVNLIFNILNKQNYNSFEYKTAISELAQIYNNLQNKLWVEICSKYGEPNETSVSHSTKKGKAILVSGSSFTDLHQILRKARTTDIDIYTNSNLLIAHAFKNFNKLKNLKGHYGDLSQNSINDFATFPGPILLTKNYGNKNEYLYRGRLYSNSQITPAGVTKIINNNYTPIIDQAKRLKGFKNGKEKNSEIVGFNINELKNNIENINEKLSSGEIKILYVIMMNGHSYSQSSYLENFIAKLDKSEFCFAFSVRTKHKRLYSINTGNFTLMNHIIMNMVRETIDPTKIIYIIKTCDPTTISQIITLQKTQIKDIYCSECSPTFIPPLSFSTLISKYNIKQLTQNPENDIRIMRQNKTAH